MPIKIGQFKYLLMSLGVMVLLVGILNKSWIEAGDGLALIVILGAFGYGVERVFCYLHCHPGRTRLSKFLTGR